MAESNGRKIEDLLFESGLLNIDEIKRIKDRLSSTGERTYDVLISEGYGSNAQIMTLIAHEMGVEYADLEYSSINMNAISALSRDIAKRYCVFPFDVEHNLLFLAMQNPDDIFMIDEIKVFAQMEIKPFLAEKSKIIRAIEHYYNTQEEKQCDGNDILQPGSNTYADCLEIYEGGYASSKSASEIMPLIAKIIEKAQILKASSIYISNVGEELRTCYRVGGRLLVEKIFCPSGCSGIFEKIETVSDMSYRNGTIEKTGQLCLLSNAGSRLSIRVSSIPSMKENMLLLKIQENLHNYRIDNLGLTEYEKNTVMHMISKRSGMVIVTGPSGSGRSATCHAMLKAIADKNLNIFAIVKNSASCLEGINNIEVPDGCKNDISEIIPAVVGYEPDVLLVDSDINSSSLKQLMDASLSGKLVIAVMGYVGVYNTIIGLVNMGIDTCVIATTLNGIISQRLIRKACADCNAKDLKTSSVDKNNKSSSSVPGCTSCVYGYKGVTALFEVFSMNHEYRQLLIKGNSLDILETKLKNEKSTFRYNYIRLVNDDVISMDEIIKLGIIES